MNRPMSFPEETKEAAAVKLRREREFDRKIRIFDSKRRTIGVDVDSLMQQVQEKHTLMNLDRQREAVFAAETLMNARIGLLREQKQKQVQRDVLNTLKEEWAHQQALATLREEENECGSEEKDTGGVSGLREMAGEDPTWMQRKREQKQQMRAWCDSLQRERREVAEKLRNIDDLYDKSMLAMTQRCMDVARVEMENRRAIQIATMNFNKSQEEENKVLRQQRAQQVNHPSLLLDPLQIKYPNRRDWRGLSAEEQKRICQQQLEQAAESRRLEEEHHARNRQWEQLQGLEARMSLLREREQNFSARSFRQTIAAENQRLAQEQNQHHHFLDREVFRNIPSEEFFTQFNTCSR
uniref:RIB43A-like with coiled-coils protein 2 n=1 Tax=Myxine glutinosa TaxID=7769 RepID=UPI00358EBDAC